MATSKQSTRRKRTRGMRDMTPHEADKLLDAIDAAAKARACGLRYPVSRPAPRAKREALVRVRRRVDEWARQVAAVLTIDATKSLLAGYRLLASDELVPIRDRA